MVTLLDSCIFIHTLCGGCIFRSWTCEYFFVWIIVKTRCQIINWHHALHAIHPVDESIEFLNFFYRWKRQYNSSQMIVKSAEDLFADPRAVTKEVINFLDMDSSFYDTLSDATFLQRNQVKDWNEILGSWRAVPWPWTSITRVRWTSTRRLCPEGKSWGVVFSFSRYEASSFDCIS